MNSKQVVDLFLEQRVLLPIQAEDILQECKLNGKPVQKAVVDSGIVDEATFYRVIAEATGTEFIDLAEREISPTIQRLIPSGLARLYQALPVRLTDGVLDIAFVNPLDFRTAEDLRFALGKEIRIVISPIERIEELINQYYGTDTSSMEDILKQLDE